MPVEHVSERDQPVRFGVESRALERLPERLKVPVYVAYNERPHQRNYSHSRPHFQPPNIFFFIYNFPSPFLGGGTASSEREVGRSLYNGNLAYNPPPQRCLSQNSQGGGVQFIKIRRSHPELVSGSHLFSFPTLQNLGQENRVFKRKNLSAVHLKDFSLNIRFLANYVVG